jgi:hypothetical protein
LKLSVNPSSNAKNACDSLWDQCSFTLRPELLVLGLIVLFGCDLAANLIGLFLSWEPARAGAAERRVVARDARTLRPFCSTFANSVAAEVFIGLATTPELLDL